MQRKLFYYHIVNLKLSFEIFYLQYLLKYFYYNFYNHWSFLCFIENNLCCVIVSGIILILKIINHRKHKTSCLSNKLSLLLNIFILKKWVTFYVNKFCNEKLISVYCLKKDIKCVLYANFIIIIYSFILRIKSLHLKYRIIWEKSTKL